MGRATTAIRSLKPQNLLEHRVWRLAGSDDGGDAVVSPVRTLPVEKLAGKLVATKVRAANGNQYWALLGNIDPRNPRKTEQFLTLAVERNGCWFHLARYFDVDPQSRGPAALARFLETDVESVFPISYDIRDVVIGNAAALSGAVDASPREKLTDDQRMDLIFEGLDANVKR